MQKVIRKNNHLPEVFIKAGSMLIPLAAVQSIDIQNIEKGVVEISYQDDRKAVAEGFDAIEAVMLLKPAALEGKRMRWIKNAWAFHNFIAHPLMQIMVWLGLKKQAIWLHDVTVPKPVGLR